MIIIIYGPTEIVVHTHVNPNIVLYKQMKETASVV